MTVKHTNFYENHREAIMRIRGTVILYDGNQPGYVHAVCNHKADGVFRVYFEEIGLSPEERAKYQGFFNICAANNPEHPTLGLQLDKWLEENKNAKISRKMMNSPLFNRFRPFPLGMCNRKGTSALYLERSPDRPKTEQGLTKSMIVETSIYAGGGGGGGRPYSNIELTSPEMKACILGEYPSADECLKNLLDPKVQNNSAAFARNFALARGPLNMIFLAYKEDTVGVLPNNNFSSVRLGKDFLHTKEVIQELGLFDNIVS